MSQTVQLLGISNAIVDILANVDHAFLNSIDAPAGSMVLINEEQARELYSKMGPATEMSGGSVANSVAGFANLGGRAAYIGNVRDDQFGDIFNHDMTSLGVDIRLQAAKSGAPTARSHVLITPDGQRTMQTYLGACTELALADISEDTVGRPDVALLEGYVWDIADGPALAKKAAAITRAHGGKVALSLSDSFCVERHRDSFLDFVKGYADIVIADESECRALVGAANYEEMLNAVRAYSNLFVITRGEIGSIVVDGDVFVEQAATIVEHVVDSTGAGDAYAAGFLFGLTNGKALQECADYGTRCATRVIQRVGARIEKGLLDDIAS